MEHTPAAPDDPAGETKPLVHGCPLVPGGLPGWRPLPDAMAIRRVEVPELAPPYDDDPRPASAGPGDAAGRAGSEGGTGTAAGPGLAGEARPPEGEWPSRFAQALAETLTGARPEHQIAPWTTEQARRKIRQLGKVFASTARPRVRRVIVCRPAAGVMEMTAVVGFGPVPRALAIRLERAKTPQPAAGGPFRPDRWRCTCIEAA